MPYFAVTRFDKAYDRSMPESACAVLAIAPTREGAVQATVDEMVFDAEFDLSCTDKDAEDMEWHKDRLREATEVGKALAEDDEYDDGGDYLYEVQEYRSLKEREEDAKTA